MWRIYIIAFAVVWFLLWGYFSNWSLHEMIWWEGSGCQWVPDGFFSTIQACGAAPARLVVGFVIFMVAVVTALTAEHK